MRSSNVMDKIESPLTCEGCIHAIVETEQSGCAFNLLGMLNAQKFDKFYVLDRTCLVKNKTPEDVDIKLGYLFILKDFKDLPLLESNILAIKDSNPLWIGVSTNDPTKNYQVAKILELAKCKYDIISNYGQIDDIYKLDQFIKVYKNGWTLVNIVGQDFDINAKDKLEWFILKDGRKAAIIKNSDNPDDIEINGICYFNFIYKYLNGSKPELNEEEKAYYTKSFAHKVYEKDPNMIVKWGDL